MMQKCVKKLPRRSIVVQYRATQGAPVASKNLFRFPRVFLYHSEGKMKYESFFRLKLFPGLPCVTDQQWECQQKEVLRRQRQTSSTSQILQEMLQEYFTICSMNTSENAPTMLQNILLNNCRKFSMNCS